MAFNLHFQETFFVSGFYNKSTGLAYSIFQSPFSGDFLCFLVAFLHLCSVDCAFQSPFSGDFLCFLCLLQWLLWGWHKLSISIFRRLSLFRTVLQIITQCGIDAFNLHFQETFFVSGVKKMADWREELSFQSPFSGDFLCFWLFASRRLPTLFLSISIFRRLSLFRNSVNYSVISEDVLSISIFRRLSLFHGRGFEEDVWEEDFQSPFSGDFLCFKSPLSTRSSILSFLSISIFRRLSLFPTTWWSGNSPVDLNFQSPFSGDFLCFCSAGFVHDVSRCRLSISIFRRLSLFLHRCFVELFCFALFQSPFSGDFLCFSAYIRYMSIGTLAFNLHFQETFFVSFRKKEKKLSYDTWAFNLHFQETFFVSCISQWWWTYSEILSISIFRRLSLFRRQSLVYLPLRYYFQSPFSGDFLCFIQIAERYPNKREIFQSPFSGDFLCFSYHFVSASWGSSFNLHFQETFFVSENEHYVQWQVFFQSPFSGDFLCFVQSNDKITERTNKLSISIFRRLSLFHSIVVCVVEDEEVTFNLHFQETFFVSCFQTITPERSYSNFQSPFSGDFLCFQSTRRCSSRGRYRLSISIFRRLSLFLDHDTSGAMHTLPSFNLHFQETFFVSLPAEHTDEVVWMFFQSPFSGDFLCFENLLLPKYPPKRFLSISIFRRLSLFPGLIRRGLGRVLKDFQSPFSGDFLCFETLKSLI